MKREELVYRTQTAIEKNIDDFHVFEIDENIIACVSLVFYPDKPKYAEVGSLYVMPFYHHRGIGRKMVDFACMKAKERGATTVIALSTQAFTFFTSVVGFEEADKDALPESRLKAYEESGRNSKVLTKKTLLLRMSCVREPGTRFARLTPANSGTRGTARAWAWLPGFRSAKPRACKSSSTRASVRGSSGSSSSLATISVPASRRDTAAGCTPRRDARVWAAGTRP